MRKIDEAEIKQRIEENIERNFGISPYQATEHQMYDALSTSINNILQEKRKAFNAAARAKKAKKVYYLCMEFLMGRSLKTSLCNLGIDKICEKVIEDYGFSLEKLYENENDAGLGNGGLGRLAACYMDSLASLNYPAMGFSIRYEYGLFKQKIVDGWQTELPDVWLPGGEVWLTPRPDKNTVVKFGGRIEQVNAINGRMEFEAIGAKEVEALAYDLMVSGGNSEDVSVLRLWRARNISKFNMGSFSQGDYMRAMQEDNEAELISKVLYPSDDHIEGKSLRLKQQYFLVCASLNSIISDVMHQTRDIRDLPDLAVIHINDTHPTLVIPELMRVLMDDYKLGWDESWDIVCKCTNYTNHTVLAEALECWSMDLFKDLLPRIWQIVCEIDARYRAKAAAIGLGQDKINRTAVIDYGAVKMANLCCIAANKVNGVSALHSDILKESVFNEYYRQTPEKFMNVTNGIAHRRWLCYSNPRLSNLLCETIGDSFYKHAEDLKNFEKFADDKQVLEKMSQIKRENKADFANYVKRTQGKIINPDSIFDCHVKRLHEYKRQLLNAMRVLYFMEIVRENPNVDFAPQTFIFAAKAAPSYYRAKEIIKLLCCIEKEINTDPLLKTKINLVFLENYCVSMAEKLMPAAEISEQISTAGKEASGTGNMKFMINGALTLGTLDGANVEIAQAVGKDNIFIFGKTAKEVETLWAQGYNSIDWFNKSAAARRVIEKLNKGVGGENFSSLVQYLINGHGISDPYMCLVDFDSYLHASTNINDFYKDIYKWNKASLYNIANAGRFAADRAIEEYAKNIWNIKKVEF